MLYNKDGTPLFKLAQKIKKDSRTLFTDLEKLRLRHELPQQAESGWVLPTSIDHEESFDLKQEGSESKHSGNTLTGDLEPALQSLELLESFDAIHRELNIELDESMPVASLFKYELAKVKPPPSEVSEVDITLDGSKAESALEGTTGTLHGGKKGGRKAKPKRDRKAEAERARRNRLAREEATAMAASAENTETMEGQSGHGEEKEKQHEWEFQAMLDSSAGFRAPLMWTTPTPLAVEDESRRTAETAIPEEASKTKKRPSAAPINQPTVPRVVITVDNRDSFNYFNAGWILPADQKRGGRAPVSQQPQQTPQPPPRKKQRTGI
jgi:NuA3 HAT complex component NTO1